ncbi:cation diffusion facilitator family transporter [Cumulibacter manganitolerans]|uniref:cation diffusion facilitator family transporter n=1 Tax=Cumulibacter manganitolerans TaxID=1884992 RepID=UPI001E476DB1|nr:cation diffusion facilitator family transporter [Cumulibacter manganitolerans]
MTTSEGTTSEGTIAPDLPPSEHKPDKPESLLTVLIALTANTLIAIAKSIVGAITGSASMIAEAAHSWADTGNEIFLLVAERRSAKPADKTHPLGYGREAYVWSMIAAFGLFSAGSIVSIWHGVTQLTAEEPEASYTWAYVVLGISFVLEGISFLQAWRTARGAARRLGMHPVHFISATSNPTLRAVFAEDAAALIGLLIAGLGIGLHQLTGNAVWDAVGSILVGVLLGIVAIFLIGRNRDFLTGQVVSEDLRQRAMDELLREPSIEAVSFLYLVYVGPSRILLIAAVDLIGDLRESELAREVQEIEDRLNERDIIERAILTLSAPGQKPGL